MPTARLPIQFSLKSVFVLVLIVAAYFGGMAVQRRETQRVLRELEQTRVEAVYTRDLALAQEALARANLAAAQRVATAQRVTNAAIAASQGEPITPGRHVRLAGVVVKWVRGDKEANYRRVEPLIREAAAQGAKIVCTTECFLDGYAIADKSMPLATYRALGESVPGGEFYQRLCGLASELNIHLVAGLLEADGDDRYNTAVLIGPAGELIGKYRKQELGHELDRNRSGDESKVFATVHGRIGVMICADRTDKDVVGRFCSAGADYLICPSGGMFGPDTNDPILQARSRENGKYIVFVHPAEFLVAAPDGAIAASTLLGDKLLVAADEVGSEADQSRVFYFDLPIEEDQRQREADPATR